MAGMERPDHVRSLAMISITLSTLALGHQYIPWVESYSLLHRVALVIVISMVTEEISKRTKTDFDFGPLTYALAVIYPPSFTFLSYAIRKHTKEIPIYAQLQAMLLGTEYTLRFRRDVDFSNIMSEHKAVENVRAIEKETVRAHRIREAVVAIALSLPLIILHRWNGIILALVVTFLYWLVRQQNGYGEVVFTKEITPINSRRGIYAIETSNLWAQHHVGVGYLENGTFTTKYHITHGEPIYLNGAFYEASYYNTETDVVTYGAPPCIAEVTDGEEIIVALSGPFSDVVVNYASTVSVNDQGYIMFAGRKSIPGTSGSPYFRVCTQEDGTVDYQFAGCIGWAVKTDDLKPNEILEIAKNSGVGTDAVIGREEIVQLITHPGSGKTRNIAQIVQAGLNIYGRVYAAGPTRGVANELLKAYEADPINGITPRVLIKDCKRSRSPSKFIISTHGTLLSMLLKRDTSVTQPGLWIIDESHFPDRNTQALKHYLRHMIYSGNMKASMYEMTATAYDIKAKQWSYADGSNHPIKDTIMKTEEMVEGIINETRKAIVFVTSIDGEGPTSSKSLAKRLHDAGKKVIEINRGNFTTAYPRAKKGDFDVVLTTNIAECGVNLDVDVCYDFQKNPRPLAHAWFDIQMTTDEITVGQLIQRRGRVGRIKEGEYIGPQTKHELKDVREFDATHIDIALFIKNFGIEPLEPVYLMDMAASYSCTHEQIMYLFSGGEKHTIQSPLTLQIVIDQRGAPRDADCIMDHIRDWNEHGDAVRKKGRRQVTAQYWDDRDSDFYWHWKDILEMHDPGDGDIESIPMVMRKKIFELTKAVSRRGVWLKGSGTTSDRTPRTSSGSDDSDGEG